MELYQILILVFFVIVFALYIVKRIWGINLLQHIVMARPAIGAVASAVDALEKVWPSDAMRIVNVALKAGAKGAEMAEEAWLMDDLDKDKRNEYAKNVARDALAEAGIDVTPQIEMIIGGIIEAVCILLPHGVKV